MKRTFITAVLVLMLTAQTVYCRPDPETGYDVQNGTVISYVGTEEYILVPAEQNGEKITKVGEKAFAGQALQSVALESGIETVGKNAFEGAAMWSADLCDTLSSVEERAFANCPNLSNVTLVNTNTHFAKGAFADDNYIVFWIDCGLDLASEQRIADNLYDAKGDTEYDIAYLHDYAPMEDGNYICQRCGQIWYVDDGQGYDGPNGALDAWDTFDDVSENAWYADYVNYAAQNGIVNGKSEHIFAPDDNITVAEAIKLAACAYAQNNGDTEIPDTEFDENWYDKYVYYAAGCGIIGGDFSVDPNRPATRAEVAYLFSRADIARYYINEVPITDIPDVNENTLYAAQILDMYNLGAAVGDADMSFRPKDNIKRSEAAAMIVRIIDYGYRIELPKG